MELRIFNTGDPVTAEFMTKITKAVVEAEKNSEEAQSKSAQSIQSANTAIATADSAKKTAEGLTGLATSAYSTAKAIETRANNGEFNGKNLYIKYNTSPSDVGAAETWQEGMKYIGFAFSLSNAAPATGYKWARFVGEAGDIGAFSGIKVGNKWSMSTNSSNELVLTYVGA